MASPTSPTPGPPPAPRPRPSRSRPTAPTPPDRKSTRLNSSHEWSSYAVFSLKKKTRLTRRRWQHRVGTLFPQQGLLLGITRSIFTSSVLIIPAHPARRSRAVVSPFSQVLSAY